MDIEKLSQQLEQKVAELIDLLGYTATITVDLVETEEKKYWHIKLDMPAGSPELIGRHGNMLDALTTVISLMAPESEERIGIVVDINNYRAERIEKVKAMALRAADDAVESGEEIMLDSMRPWERREIHIVLKERTDILTESVGEEPDRRVIIKPAI